MFVKFPSIESLHHIRRDVVKGYLETVRIGYRPKIKLHGTNAGITIRNEKVVAQSRNRLISPSDDNCGFAEWVHENYDHWVETFKNFPQVVTVFGEWCGKTIMKGVSISEIDTKAFCIFAIQKDDVIIYEPEQISELIGEPLENVYVLPWQGERIDINYALPVPELQDVLDSINSEIQKIEACDPWVKETFGIEGPGEGFVFYPVNMDQMAGGILRNDFSAYVFKAKGEKHRVQKQKSAVEISPEEQSSITEFVDTFATEPRFEQAINEMNLEYDARHIGPFIGWVCKDIKKETVREVEESGLDWKLLTKAIAAKARLWFINKIETQ